MELHLIRHIKPDYPEGTNYGQTDVPLPADYHLIHAGIVEQLAAYDAVYSSPLSRCRLLAAAITPHHQVDSRLMELHFGDWEGRKWDDIDREELDPWMADYINLSPPNGESLQTLVKRFAGFVEELQAMPHQRVLVVTHAGIIRSAMHLFNNIPLDQVMMEKVAYGGRYTFNTK
ncbi:alpha-ribazole phosphatase family protein [Chitinophaga rhizophila]|uniref:Alpha-ribazole phosphatase family protein n=1 Tax=Chitinophaga rhizophila TaxID=2866212 RepID=A0ABS7GHD5_9BACT|nr:alpha-ribazole phosphatase family protein [Chitinophaga rhizophila]MBW8687093.1 alpha-ribazole phosphatase family protein [Chitinophaga rhizophila]